MDGLILELVQYWALTKAYFVFDTARLGETDMIIRLCLQAVLLFGSAFFQDQRPRFSPCPGLICRNCAGSVIPTQRPSMPCWISPGA